MLLASLVAAGPAGAAPVPGFDVNYTTDADFDQGDLVNVNHDAPNNNQLQLNTSTGTFKFIWVALSRRCTIAKIDTETGAILGEYRTLSDSTSCPESSRTTVALDGSVWVGHRGGGGTVTHVALVERNDCVDRNGNGTIETSTGYDDVLAWPGTNAPVSAAQDECILHSVPGSGGNSDSRHMSIDADNNLWVGDRNGGSIFRKIDGDTGALLQGPLDFPCGGYGGLIDGNGVIWSATSASSFLRWDTNLPPSSAQCLPYTNYGMAIDSHGNVWVSTLTEGIVRKFAPSGTLLGTFPQGNASAQGLAVDNNDDVWISSSLFCGGGCNVSHLRNDGSLVGNVPTPTGSGSTGVAVDAAGKVWTANLNSHTAVRIDPAAGPVVGGTPLGAADLTVSFPAGSNGRPLPFPYNYSDMTGQQLFNTTAPQGTWTVVQDSGQAGTEWGTITWNAEPQGSVPAGSTLIVEARAADTQAALGSQPYAAVSSGVEFAAPGQFIQVRVTMKPNTDGESPVLSDIHIEAPPPVEVSVNDKSVTEGNTGLSPATPATFTVSLDNASTQPVSVAYETVDATASSVASADFVAASGTVTFAPGDTSEPVTISVRGDLADEPNETYELVLSDPTNAQIGDGEGLGTIVDDDRSGAFSCRGAGIRAAGLEIAVSNAPDAPCKDASASLLDLPLGLGTVAVGAKVINSATNQTPDDLVTTTPAIGDRSEATAEASTVVLVAGLSIVRATVVRTHAQARCEGAAGSAPVLSASTTITGLTVNGQPVAVANGEVKINLLLGVLHINNTTTTATSITKRGIWFENKILPSSLDIVVAEAKANFSGNPCK